jgi:hypothetical protein
VHSTEETWVVCEYASLLIQTLLTLMAAPDVEIHLLAVNAVLLMVSRLRLRFIPFILSVRKVGGKGGVGWWVHATFS